MLKHQYIERATGRVVDEKPIGDYWINLLYGPVREHAPSLFRMLISSRMSALLGYVHFDLPGATQLAARAARAGGLPIDWSECMEPLDYYSSRRRIFERQIRYWERRPMDESPYAIASPADARVLLGNFSESDMIFVKNKFFDLKELLGAKNAWSERFEQGDFAVFRLTPDKYHYNHTPVNGVVEDFYELEGIFHSCNPCATLAAATPFSKNRRVVTIINTDVEGGTSIGLVAMIEITALMIGAVRSCYSEQDYENPREIEQGMRIIKGCPKSLYEPGSSTDVLIFEPGRMAFSDDLVAFRKRSDVASRFSIGLGEAAVEIDVTVRSTIGHRLERP